jgi:hypothetical protein
LPNDRLNNPATRANLARGEIVTYQAAFYPEKLDQITETGSSSFANYQDLALLLSSAFFS